MNRLNAKQQKIFFEFEAAIRAHEMRGAQPPEDHQNIEKRYKLAREHMIYSLILAGPR